MPARRPAWRGCLVLLCLLSAGAVVIAQSVGDISTGSGSNNSTPATTAPATTAPATTAPPASTAPPTSTPVTSTPIGTVTPTTTATTAPAQTSSSPAVAVTTAAPVVSHYNSSTLPPGVDQSMLDGAELVTVEVTETTLADGSTSYSYVIVTKSGSSQKTIVLTPTATSSASTGGSNNVGDDSTSAQPGSSLADGNSSASKSPTIGVGAIVAIIAGAVIFILVLFAFFIAQRRRQNRRPSDVSSEDVLESPAIGKQARLLESTSSPAEVEYQEITRTTANSRSSGGSSRRYRSTLWEDPVILAARIPIDRVELGAVISRGGFGLVYRGTYRDQDVAVKTLLPERRKDLEYIQAFLSEVRLMATMEHPHIVQFIGVAWESLSDLYCVSEFMGGGDLRSLLRDYLANGVPQGMDASKVQIAYQVAYALTYLHSLDPVVLHRDLKSRNILLTTSLDAKVTDFGASRIRSDATMTAGVGSSLWMAPEVMMGRRYDEKADVFSLGVVISELDTHELPYSHAKEGGNSSNSSSRPLPDTAVLQMVSTGKLRVRCSRFMNPDMARFVSTCVSLDPRERPTAAEVLYFLQIAIRNQQY